MANLLALIVEDDAGLRMIYDRLLHGQGYEIMTAENGADALEILANQVPNLMFLDMRLPYVSGEEVVNYMVQNAHMFQGTHVVIASSNKQYAHHAESLPWSQFILKPILPNKIREIAQYVAEHA